MSVGSDRKAFNDLPLFEGLTKKRVLEIAARLADDDEDSDEEEILDEEEFDAVDPDGVI
jgi:hypothetical protein